MIGERGKMERGRGGRDRETDGREGGRERAGRDRNRERGVWEEGRVGETEIEIGVRGSGRERGRRQI